MFSTSGRQLFRFGNESSEWETKTVKEEKKSKNRKWWEREEWKKRTTRVYRRVNVLKIIATSKNCAKHSGKNMARKVHHMLGAGWCSIHNIGGRKTHFVGQTAHPKNTFWYYLIEFYQWIFIHFGVPWKMRKTVTAAVGMAVLEKCIAMLSALIALAKVHRWQRFTWISIYYISFFFLLCIFDGNVV